MKKLLSILLLVVLSTMSAAVFIGCKKTTYNITYVIEGAIDEPDKTTYSVSRNNIALWEPEAPDNDHYFDGWYDNDSYAGIKIGDIQSGWTGDITVYGRMVNVGGYTITYIIDGEEATGVPNNRKTYSLSNNAFVLWQPEHRDNYYFSEWYEDAEMTSSIVSSIPMNTIGNKTFYGAFVEGEAPNTFPITFIFNGVEQTNAGMKTYRTINRERDLWIPQYNQTTYGFDGWYLNEDFTGNSFKKIPANTSGALTYYGRYKEPEGYGQSTGRKKAIDFTLTPTGQEDNPGITEEVSLANSFGKRALILNFWSSNCKYCKAEKQAYQEAYDQYKDDILFLFVNAMLMSDTVTGANDYMRSAGWTFGWVYDKEASAHDAFKVNDSTGIPVTVIIDKWGYVSYKQVGQISLATLRSEIQKVI